MQRVFEADDQRYRHGCAFAERQKRQARSHVADIAIGAGKGLDGAIGERIAAQETADDEKQDEHRIGCRDIGGDEIDPRQLLDRRARDELEEQSGQGGIDDEGIQPAERFGRLLGRLGGDVTDQDQAKERQKQADNIGQEVFQGAGMIGGSGSDLSNSSKSV
jgi:hypothetical protein